jgi:hypothetical protein
MTCVICRTQVVALRQSKKNTQKRRPYDRDHNHSAGSLTKMAVTSTFLQGVCNDIHKILSILVDPGRQFQHVVGGTG